MTALDPAPLASSPSLAWTSAVEAWVRSMAATGATPLTLRLRRLQIMRLARDLSTLPDPWAVTGDELEDWLGSHGWAPATLCSHRAALREFYAWGVRRRKVATSPAAELLRVRQPRATPRLTPEIAYQHAQERADARLLLIMRLAAELGLRRAEVSRVHTSDLEQDLDGWTLLVHGKGRKTRRMPIDSELAAELLAMPAGYLFPGKDDGHLSPDRVGRIVAAALPGVWTMHTLRHRFGTVAYEDSGHDLATVQDLLGHSSPVTTRIYVQVPAENLRRTVEAVSRRTRRPEGLAVGADESGVED